MKIVLAILIAVSGNGAFAKNKAKPAPKAPVAEAAEEKVERFAELRLRGNLKRPELSYDFEDESKTSEIPLNSPDDFNDELFRDVDKQ